MARVLAILMLSVTLAAAAAAAAPRSRAPDVEGFEARLGGSRGVHEFFKSSAHEEIKALVEEFGMGYFPEVRDFRVCDMCKIK